MKTARSWRWLGLSGLALLVIAGLSPLTFDSSRKLDSNLATANVTRGEFAVRSVYNGKLEARNVVTITSTFEGMATVVDLASEGAEVGPGDVLVRFDSASLERELVKLEKEHALAKSELTALKQAKLPLELRGLELALIEVRGTLKAERQYLSDSVDLQKDGLISDQEVKQQELKVKGLESKHDKLKLEYQLTKEYLQPSALEAARTKLLSASQALALARRQLENTVIVAPSSGVVVYKPLNISGEYRTVRVGDNIYRNQQFIVLPDMRDLVVHCDIPESELSRVTLGGEVFVRPLAYADLTLPGTVLSIGSVAQSLPQRPAWQKFFHVVIEVDEFDPRLRPGMSVTAHVLSFYKPDVTLIPRRAVSWDAGRALSKVVVGRSYVTRELTLGMANDMYYEVISGVESGDKVLIQ
jgi:multidrug resistance efflux pump